MTLTLQEIYDACDDTERDYPTEDEYLALASAIVECDPESVLAFIVYEWAELKLAGYETAEPEDTTKKDIENLQTRIFRVEQSLVAMKEFHNQRGLEPMGIAVERLREMINAMVKRIQSLEARLNAPIPVAPPITHTSSESGYEFGSGSVTIAPGTAHTFNGAEVAK